MATLTSICMGGFGAGRLWMSVFPSECIWSQKITVAVMGLKGEETWEDPKS